MRIVMLGMVCAVALTGCKQGESTPWDEIIAAAKEGPTASLVSPDAAVKSWWAAKNAESSLEYLVCQKTSPVLIKASRVDGIASGDAKIHTHRRYACIKDVYEREISKVTVESETRAVVQAKIKKVVRADDLSPYEADSLSMGGHVRYLLERGGAKEGWKVAQVYGYRDYVTNDHEVWYPLYTDKRSANVHINYYDQ